MIFEKSSKILFIGDSISDYDRARPVGEGLFNAWGRSYVADVGSLIGCMYPEEHLRIVNMGIGGNQCRDLEARWQTDVFDQNPDYVSILIGINDVWRQFDSPLLTEQHVSPEEYRANYEKLIEQTLPITKGMILMSPYVMEPNKNDAMRARMDEYTAIVKELAEKYNLIYVDLQTAWDKLFEHMHPMNIAWDRIHPNQIGAMYIAKQFLAAVGFDR
jgi:lysophospholipase L1-like esterase